jgi:hypothetical protein
MRKMTTFKGLQLTIIIYRVILLITSLPTFRENIHIESIESSITSATKTWYELYPTLSWRSVAAISLRRRSCHDYIKTQNGNLEASNRTLSYRVTFIRTLSYRATFIRTLSYRATFIRTLSYRATFIRTLSYRATFIRTLDLSNIHARYAISQLQKTNMHYSVMNVMHGHGYIPNATGSAKKIINALKQYIV